MPLCLFEHCSWNVALSCMYLYVISWHKCCNSVKRKNSVSMFLLPRSLCQRNIPQNTSHFIIRFTKIHYCWPCRKFLTPNMNDCGKLRYIKVQKCNFRTTQNLHLSPYVAMILRPALRVGAFLVGRRLKKWWTRKSDEEKKEYKQWFNERRNVFLGELRNAEWSRWYITVIPIYIPLLLDSHWLFNCKVALGYMGYYCFCTM